MLIVERAWAELAGLRSSPRGKVLRTSNGVTFEFDMDLGPMIKKMYLGTYEMLVVDVLRRYLRTGDVFVDIGASIGYISAIASALVGEPGEVHAFEPVPTYYGHLKNFRDYNSGRMIETNNLALGDRKGRAEIAIKGLDNIGWNTMVPHFMESEGIAEVSEVEIETLDAYVQEHALRQVSFIKIDTEGYELPILKGASETLEHYRPPVLCEIAPAAYPNLGMMVSELGQHMESLGYKAVELIDDTREMSLDKLSETTNVLFLQR